MKILLVIDMQKGFIKNAVDYLIPKINSLVFKKDFDEVIYTQFVNNKNCPCFTLAGWDGMKTKDEQQIIVDIKEGSRIFKKNIHGLPVKIINYIKSLPSASSVFLCGLDTDACVFAAAHQLFDAGIKPYILKEYTATSSSRKYLKDYSLEIMSRSFGDDAIIEKF